MFSPAYYRTRPSGQGLAEDIAKAKAALAAPPPSDGTVSYLVSEFITQAKPVVVNEVLPAVTRDPAIQRNVGSAIGSAAADRLRTPVLVGVAAIVIAAGAVTWRALAKP